MEFMEEKNRFIAMNDAQEVMGEITYSPAGEHLWIIDHTQVNDQFRGQKVGNQLVEHLAGEARNRKKKILPLCPFAKKITENDFENYQDILH